MIRSNEGRNYSSVLTFPLKLGSLRGHFQSKWIAFEANASMALPEFVYVNLDICYNRQIECVFVLQIKYHQERCRRSMHRINKHHTFATFECSGSFKDRH